MHYYQFNIGDYAKSTLHLSILEDLAYRRLLDRYYDTEKPLEADLTKLCRFIRMGSYEKETQQILDEFFSLTQKGWIQKRVQKELGAYSAKADAARANGKLGGRPKKTQSVNLANPTLTQEKAKQETLTIKQETINKEILIPVGINAVAWNEWIAYRQSKKKKVSKAAAAKQFKLLANHALDVQQEIINQSIQNDYQGLFEPKGNSNGSYQQANQPNRKLSVVERTKLANEERERARQARAGYGSTLAAATGNLRPPVEQPIRCDNSRELGSVIDGSFSRAD